MKKLFLLLPFLLLLTACGDARETSVLSPVSALAFTQTDTAIRLMAETAWQDSTEGTAAAQYFSGEGTDIPTAFSAAAAGIGSDLYFSHAQVILLDSVFAKQQILPLCEYLCSNSELRLGLRLAVARDASAEDILQAWAPNGEIPGFALERILSQGKNRGNAADMPFFRFYNDLLQQRTTLLPAVTIGLDGQAFPNGSAVFENGTFSYFTEGSTLYAQ